MLPVYLNQYNPGAVFSISRQYPFVIQLLSYLASNVLLDFMLDVILRAGSVPTRKFGVSIGCPRSVHVHGKEF